jgi:hypothetical protein
MTYQRKSFKKNYCVPFVREKHILVVLSLSVSRQGKLHALYTKSARGWYLHYALIPRTSTSISFALFIIAIHPLCVRILLICQGTNKLMVTIRKLHTAFLDGEASCPDTKHAQTESRRHAGGAVLRLCFSSGVPIRHSSATERTSPSYWVGTERDGWDGTGSTARACRMLPV